MINRDRLYQTMRGLAASTFPGFLVGVSTDASDWEANRHVDVGKAAAEAGIHINRSSRAAQLASAVFQCPETRKVRRPNVTLAAISRGLAPCRGRGPGPGLGPGRYGNEGDFGLEVLPRPVSGTYPTTSHFRHSGQTGLEQCLLMLEPCDSADMVTNA